MSHADQADAKDVESTDDEPSDSDESDEEEAEIDASPVTSGVSDSDSELSVEEKDHKYTDQYPTPKKKHLKDAQGERIKGEYEHRLRCALCNKRVRTRGYFYPTRLRNNYHRHLEKCAPKKQDLLAEGRTAAQLISRLKRKERERLHERRRIKQAALMRHKRKKPDSARKKSLGRKPGT